MKRSMLSFLSMLAVILMCNGVLRGDDEAFSVSDEQINSLANAEAAEAEEQPAEENAEGQSEEQGEMPAEEAGEGNEQDPELAELEKADEEHERRSQELAERFHQTEDENERTGIADELKTVVTEHFDLRQKRRVLEVTRLEQQIEKLRKAIERREAAKDSLIQTRIVELTGDNEDLDF